MDAAVLKSALRWRILQARMAEPDKDEKSRIILEQVFRLPQFQSARTVAFYVDVGSEVRTRPFLPQALALGKRVAVPYCEQDERGERLRLFLLRDLSELERGAYGVWEPRAALRERADRRCRVEEVDLMLVPGVVFDRRGGRIGRGGGHYDQLLREARPDCWLVGLAYECQVVEEVPMEPHDVYLDLVITERATYRGTRGRSG